MSEILPMANTWRPAALARSSSVGSGGEIAKSRRLPVRLKVSRVSPVKGRAMTRPIISGAVSVKAISQTS